MLLSNLLLGALAACAAQEDNPPPNVTVYRDDHGVPHIQATTEEAAWYAMGYEEARDSLFSVQVSLKMFTGHAAEYLATPATREMLLWNDFIVDVFKVDQSGTSTANLMPLLASDPAHPHHLTATQDQFFENLTAYAKGLDDYRAHYKNNVLPTDPMRAWLDAGGMSWVYTHPITVGQVASYGGYGKAVFSFGLLGESDPTPSQPKFSVPGGDGPETPGAGSGEEGSAEAFEPALSGSDEGGPWGEFVSGLSDLISVGSNGFCWTNLYTRELVGGVDVGYTANMADPHWQFLVFAGEGSKFHNVYDHTWFCHLKVTPEGAVAPTLNSYGHLVHGSGAFFVSHNEDVSISGTQGSPNISDCFLLNVKDLQTQQPLYYDYARDPTGVQVPSSWVPFTKKTVSIQAINKTGALVTVQKEYWEAGRFGIVVHPEPFWADPTREYNQQDLQADKNLLSTPSNGVQVLASYRLPGLKDVDGSSHHFRLNVAQYEAMRARSIYDVVASVNNHDFGFMINLMATDREGRLFGTVNGTIPQRAYTSNPLVAAAVYGATKGQPVPALTWADQKYDWVTSGGVLQYLDIKSYPGSPNKQQPFIIHDPSNGLMVPPGHNYTEFENPGFMNFSNDNIFYAWRDRYEKTIPGNLPTNRLLETILDAQVDPGTGNLIYGSDGTLYHTAVVAFEAHHKNQYLTQALKPIWDQLTGGQGAPAMTIAQSKELAMDNRLYAPEEYPDQALAHLPLAIRSLREMLNQVNAGAFDKERHFWEDLWSTLYSPPAGWSSFPIPFPSDATTPVLVNLKEVWVDNQSPVFWQSNGGTISSIQLPSGAALLDFHPDTFVPLTSSELSQLNTLVSSLESWSANPSEKYKNSSNSTAAALLFTYVNSLSLGKHRWIPLEDGKIFLAPLAETDCPQGNLPLVTQVSPGFSPGDIPALGMNELQQFRRTKGSYLKDLVVPLHSIAMNSTARGVEKEPGQNSHLQIPYSALYSDQLNRVVKTNPDITDITALVEYFAKLGGWWDGGAPSQGGVANLQKKAVAWNKVKPCSTEFKFQHTRGAIQRDGYPFSSGLAREHLLRRLLAADEHLNPSGSPTKTLGDVLRVRAYDVTGKQHYPATGDLPCEGGYIRRVQFKPLEQDEDEGFVTKALAYSGSKNPLMTFFPDNGGPAQSFFWTFPGQNIMDQSPAAPNLWDHVDAFRNNQLKGTHFSDYLNHPGTLPPVFHYYQ